MRAVPVLLRLGGVLAGFSVLTGAAADGVSPTFTVGMTATAAVVIATAGFIAWIEKKIDARVAEKIEPVKQQVQALYNHFLGGK